MRTAEKRDFFSIHPVNWKHRIHMPLALMFSLTNFFSCLTENVGLKWSELKKVLNQEFDWENLIINTPNMPKISLPKVSPI